MAGTILIVDDEETLRESMARLLTREGYSVSTARTGEGAMDALKNSAFDLVISDIFLPGIDGIEVLRRLREKKPDQLVILMTAYASLETAVDALRAGAYDYIMKPIIHEEVKPLIRRALRQQSLMSENSLLRKQIEREYDFSHIIGVSSSTKKVLEEVTKVADARSSVLILGETGTGKELIARAIHYNSRRREKAFVPINCSAIPDTLLESELFGHVKGAFTGAMAAKKRTLRGGGGRHGFLRRDRGDERDAPVKAASGTGRPGGPSCRRDSVHKGGLEVHHGHQQRPPEGRADRDVPGRPLLQDQYNKYPALSPPGAAGDIPLLARHFLARLRSGVWKAGQSQSPTTPSPCCLSTVGPAISGSLEHNRARGADCLPIPIS